MTNINVNIVGTSKLGPIARDFAALETQVAALNAQLAKTIDTSKAVDASGYQRLSKAAALNSRIFRDAAASTGMFEVQQVRLNSATDDYVKKLRAQKIGFRELIRTRKIATAAYKEQLAMENMLVRRGPANNATGKEVFDVLTPKRYSAELDNAGRKLAWFSEQLKSGGRQMINWGKNTQWSGRQLMIGFTLPLAAFGAATGVLAYQIDQQMTRVRKVYDTTADSASANLKDITAVTKELEEVTRMGMETATQAAKAYGQAGVDTLEVQAELAATGKTGLDLQRSTLEVMRIARLGEVENDVAINATVALQSVFRDTITTSEDLADAFNYMNAVENATSLSTKDFAEAIPVAAAAVKTWGGDVKELGILLTAMKENGIGASEGANAIKATMQRLARPSKQVREEWQAITGTDILQITENAESLSDVFTQIFHATEQLSDADKRKAFAGLFGSYQVSRMMALTKGMGELEQGVGQVSRAYDIAGKAPEQWATIADAEMKRYRESISGQFKVALEDLKMQLAQMGGPFVEAATMALQAVSGIIEAFNNLPSSAKKLIAFMAVLAGIAGPVVMLTGLFANLAGNAVSAFGVLLKGMSSLGTSMNILDKENRIAAASAKMMEQGAIGEAAAVRGLTAEINKWTASQEAANLVTQQGLAQQVVPRANNALKAQQAQIAQHQRFQQFMNTMLYQGPQGDPYYGDAAGNRFTPTETERRARALMAEDDAKIAAAAAQTEQSMARTKRHIATAAVGTAAMATGMLLVMTNSEGTAAEIGNMLILGSIVVPAAIGLAKAAAWAAREFKLAAMWSGVVGARQKVAAAVTTVGAAAQARWAVAMAATAAGSHRMATTGGTLLNIFKAIPAFLGPMNLLVAGVATVGAGIWLWKRHIDAVKKEQAEMHMNVNDLADEWANKMNLVKKEYKDISSTLTNIQDKTKFQTYMDAYTGGDFKDKLASFDDEDLSAQERYMAAADQFATLQRDYGMSAQDAALSINAMYQAAGRGALEANIVTEELLNNIGTLDAMGGLQIQIDSFFEREAGTEEAKDAGHDVGVAFAQGMQETNLVTGPKLMEAFSDTIGRGWDETISNIAGNDTFGQEIIDKFKEVGIGSSSAIREAMSQAGGAENLINQLFPDVDDAHKSELFDALEAATRDAVAAERSMVAGVVSQLGLSEDIKTLQQLQNTIEGVVATASSLPAARVQEFYDILSGPQLDPIQAMLQGYTGVEIAMAGATEESKLQYMNSILTARGFQKVETNAEAVAIATGKIKPEIAKARTEAGRLASAMGAVRAAAVDIAQEAMGAVQQSIADDYTNMMEAQYDADVENTQTYWDNKVEQAGNAGERARAALDKAWEKRNSAAEKYWDNRIEMVDKAIEAEEAAEEKRQKMFDAEVARIEKLNDMANANIDFNVALNEGNLDEAAKLRNDMQSEVDAQAIDRARGEMATASERRVDKLENRKDRLEKQRDKAMEAMRKEEEAQKAHLERMTENRQNALEEQRDIEVAEAEARRDRQKAQLEREIAMFMAGTATSKKELRKRMEDAGLDYDKFEKEVIIPKGLNWGKYFGDMLHTELKRSADKIRQDAMWEQMGADTLESMARGMGFSGKRSLMHFLKTGEIKDFHEDTPAAPNTSGGSSGPRDPDLGGQSPEKRHGGGFVGKGGESRKGIARTYQGLHPSETMLLAQKGEFVVNKDAATKHKDMLNAINNDNAKGQAKNGRGGEGQGPAPFFGAAFNKAIARKTSESLGIAVNKKKAEQAKMAAAYAGGGSYFGAMGHYSLPGVKPWVLEAANYLGGKFGISSIGGVGSRSNNPTSDHPRGLALDFMTSDVGKGNALATEAIRLAGALDATYMIWQKRIHSFDSRGWQPYSHPSGASSPTLDHMDHVHMSFSPTGDTGDLPKPTTSGPGAVPGGATGPRGTGAMYRASVPGKGWNSSHDYNNDYHSPIFAIGSGYVSERIFGPEAGSGQHPRAYPRGYGSYGVQALFRGDNGVTMSASHLWPGTVRSGRVQGGQQIAQSASTGNSSGSHTHFEVNGSTNAQSIFAAMGIPLQKGAAEVMFDNTLANLHKGEAVLTRDLNAKFHQGVERFANGGGDEYTIIVNPSTGMDEEKLANKVIYKIDKKQRRRPTTRTVGKR